MLFGRALRPAEAPSRLVRSYRVTDRAVVLGSTQPESHIDRPAAEMQGVDVVRRGSGGGAVLVEPDGLVWVDVVLSAGDPLWEDDVGRAFWWLGESWAAALRRLGLGQATVHRGPLITSRWSPMVCFAGLGPGEVTVDGRKVLGMAQRRTRAEALFQCALPLTPQPDGILPLLALEPEDGEEAADELAPTVGRIEGVPAPDVLDAFLSCLP